jgi:hypothetical protein
MAEETHMEERNTGYLKHFRLSFPDDEKIYDWLSPLLDAYYVVDKGIAGAIRKERKKERLPVANAVTTAAELIRPYLFILLNS